MALSTTGYACSSTDALILGSKDDDSSKDGGGDDIDDRDGGDAVGDGDAGNSPEDGGGGGTTACSDGSPCSDPAAVCAYRIQDACAAVGECMVPTTSDCAPSVEEIGCDCSGKIFVTGAGCDTVGLPDGYTRAPLSERFEQPAQERSCPNDGVDLDGGAADDDGG